MVSRIKERLDRLARANEQARKAELEAMTLERAARIMEGLLSHPLGPPPARTDHPVSLSRRLRRRDV